MKQTVYFSNFRDAFQSIRPSNFTYEGLEVLFQHLEELERDTGEDYELDVIALCCDFSENTFEVISEEYSIELTGSNDEENKAIVEEYLIDEGIFVGEVKGGFVYRQH